MGENGNERRDSKSANEERCSSRLFCRLGRRLMEYDWARNLWADLTGPYAYRTWIVILTTVVAAYFGTYAVIESRHDRQMSRAMFERNTFMTMVSSGSRGTFVAAMKNFGPIQTMSVPQSPPLFPPWKWFETELPNLKPLWRWARHRFSLCIAMECGNEDSRIDLRGSDFTNAGLSSVDLNEALLTGANLTGAKLSSANLTGAILDYANLTDTDLIAANLTDAHLINADLSGADMTGAFLNNADLSKATLPDAKLSGATLPKAKLMGAHLIDADLTEAHLIKADLTGAFLNGVDLSGAFLAGADFSDVDLTLETLENIFFSAYWDETTVWPEDQSPPCERSILGERCTR